MRHSRSVQCAEVARRRSRGSAWCSAAARPAATASRNTSTWSPVTMRRRPRPNTRSIVGGRHRSLLGPLPTADAPARQRGRALAKPARCTSSTVASSALPLRARELDQVVAAARERHRLRRARRRQSRGVDVLVHAVAAQHEHLAAAEAAHARRWRRWSRRCRPCAPGRRASRPAAAPRRGGGRCRRASAARARPSPRADQR